MQIAPADSGAYWVLSQRKARFWSRAPGNTCNRNRAANLSVVDHVLSCWEASDPWRKIVAASADPREFPRL
jgi:hypothetical protein